ncbi:saccharopine dehydrogenase NADP-binding domain-containing protein [Streptomyces tubbatahanensis]|uniref:Saccharopine dehydrogenase NADP-binding domain-containing protein n=1 Tax=Streptomyces tubbatahanensis TaxID=2923272 RepID=A0ABY3Y1J1_9ACTN|nr:saccharopine dehydrogenase NADP-binding domain-containing protein [Streptomyces tubbatahanensis]UNT00708.1 saccharopine dehydrogenase NADP-binding domain-containing protein [Streptomyces tubbatahanensis]
MGTGSRVTVFGAYGHTGRFVVAHLRDRGFVPVLSGRDAGKLATMAASTDGLEARRASVDEAASLDRAVAGAAAVVNCAGPFATTAAPVMEAALRAGIPYLDVAAEIEANLDAFTHFADRARAARAVIVPAMAFYGGLGDLLVTAAMGDWARADEAHVAYGLSSWHPTAGTRAAGAVSRQRRGGRGLRYTNGRLEYHHDEPRTLPWPFPDPMGPRTVVAGFTMADVVTVPSHLPIPAVHTYMTAEAARDVSAPDTPAPAAADEGGRSAQTFLVDVVVRFGGVERRAVARGQDIYAVTAPLVVEALDRVLTGRTTTAGVACAGEIFDAPDFLRALSPHLSWEMLPGRAASAARVGAP